MSAATAQPKTIEEAQLCAICKYPMSGDSSDDRKLCDVCMGTTPTSYPAPTHPANPSAAETTERADSPLKRCPKCGDSFPLDADHWYGDRKARTGFKTWCKGCDRLATKSNREKRKGAPARSRNKADQLPTAFMTPGDVRESHQYQPRQPQISIAIDFSDYPDVLDFFTTLARDQERTLEAQIRWTLRQLAKQRTMEAAHETK